MSNSAANVAAEIRTLARITAGRAARLAEYADAVENMDAFDAQMGDEFASSGFAAQMLGEVESVALRPGETFEFMRALTAAVVVAQRAQMTT